MAEETKAGTVIGGRYRLVEKLGAGGFGRVWSARDEMLDIDVAIKEVWLPSAISDAERSERLVRAEREARNAVRLRDHPHIVAVHDVAVGDGVPWIVMQLVAGHSLEERLRIRGFLTPAEAVTVAAGILSALEAAHAVGVVHRDIKPGNVLLTDDSNVLLADFGIAVHQADTALTATGAFIGSMEYVAPERARGTDGLAASDLFSLGATLYQAVEGFSPFRRDTPTGSLTAVLFEQPPPPRRAGGLAPLLAALLAKDPEARPTARQAFAMLGKAAESSVESAAAKASQPSGAIPLDPRATMSAAYPYAPSPAPPAAGRKGRRRVNPWLTVVAGAALVAVTGAGIRWAQSGSGSSDSGSQADTGPSSMQLQAADITTLGTQYTNDGPNGVPFENDQQETNGGCVAMDNAAAVVGRHPGIAEGGVRFSDNATGGQVVEGLQYYGTTDAKTIMTYLHQEAQCKTWTAYKAQETLVPLAAPTGTSEDCVAFEVRRSNVTGTSTLVTARVGGILITFYTDMDGTTPEIITADQVTTAVNSLHAVGLA